MSFLVGSQSNYLSILVKTLINQNQSFTEFLLDFHNDVKIGTDIEENLWWSVQQKLTEFPCGIVPRWS